jgi:peptidyl-tRNA hydrolase
MMDPKDYVLSQFLKEEMETVRQAVEKAAQAVEDWAFRGIGYVMDNYNRQSDEEP